MKALLVVSKVCAVEETISEKVDVHVYPFT
jgi:hypothetical protein